MQRLAFVDLETTGMGARGDAITEIGIVRVERDGPGSRVTEWSTLVNPGQPIPAAIQALTGITDAMVRGAPSFAAVAHQVRALLSDAVLVAHNARFDYAFLKHAFARLGERFSARVLCTVRLSRRLFPDAPSHSLDALISRHHLRCDMRHRALSDARAVWSFMQKLEREIDASALAIALRRVLRTPSLPPHLPADAIESLPEAPGVYLFYGLNALPLYIGKSRNLRERVGAHFSSDYRSATDLRLSSEVRRIEHEETAGEIGALLREAQLVKALLPAHNHALRRKAAAGVLELTHPAGPPRFVSAAMLEPRDLAGRYGPFTSRQQARATLHALAREHRLCLKALGLERRIGACFARQLARCDGACVGAEPAERHHERLAAALAPWRVPAWPFEGMVVVHEPSAIGDRTDTHLVHDWCWLGTARDEAELARLIDVPPRATFDVDVARLLIRTAARKHVTFSRL